MSKFAIQPTDALIIVDVQNDFCSGGALEVREGDEVVPALNSVISMFQWVVATQDWHPPNHCSFQEQGGPWPVHCVAGTHGAALHSRLDPSFITYTVKTATRPDREAYSGFDGEPDLAELLRNKGVERVFVGGLATDYCVRATSLDARKAGFEVVLLTDAVRAVNVDPRDGDGAIEEMAGAGVSLVETLELG